MQKITSSRREPPRTTKLTDHEVDLIRDLYENHRIMPKALAEKFEVHVQHIKKIVAYERRQRRQMS